MYFCGEAVDLLEANSAYRVMQFQGSILLIFN
jgi:hypothetical protein